MVPSNSAGWQSSASKVGCFQRVRYTGGVVNMPAGLRVSGPREIEITFTSPLEDKSADPQNFALEQWNYVWGPKYGSPDMKPSRPGEHGRDPVEITAARLSEDRRSIRLTTGALLTPVMQFKLRLNVVAETGDKVMYDVFGTINAVPAP